MRGGNIAQFIQDYDLVDYLQHAAAMLDKISGMDESTVKENQEGPADLLAAVEEEINNPGMAIDNLMDVMNATHGSDKSPEFKKARAIIAKYIDLVDNASVGSEEDGIEPMRGGDIARHIRDYDLTDRLQHAAAMLDKIAGMGGDTRAVEDQASRWKANQGYSMPSVKNLSPDAQSELKALAKSSDIDRLVGVYYDGKSEVSKFIRELWDEIAYDMGKMGEEPDNVNPEVVSTIQSMFESRKVSKKTVKESYERKLTFRDMIKLVQESGGQQAIDPMDKELFAWASRVAKQKLGEGTKAEVYAGLVYERMGGVFKMYDVLSEGSFQKKK